MNNFIPYEKLSKKKKRELDNSRRGTWGELNPVTRRPIPPKAYNRSKARKWNYDDSSSVLCFCFRLCRQRPSITSLRLRPRRAPVRLKCRRP